MGTEPLAGGNHVGAAPGAEPERLYMSHIHCGRESQSNALLVDVDRDGAGQITAMRGIGEVLSDQRAVGIIAHGAAAVAKSRSRATASR